MKYDRSAADGLARILVADDDADVCALLARALRPSFAVTTVHDARDALDVLARDDSFALVISDAMLPGATSRDLVRSIRANPGLAAMPILMLAGVPSAHQVRAIAAAGADAVLDKPFSLAKLRSTVWSLVGGEATRSVGS